MCIRDRSLDKAIRDTVEQKTGSRPIGKIRMLAHLRYFGYCFNPVSFYYCFDKDDNKVEFILSEVTNTPWKERFSYVLRASNNKQENKIKSEMKKELHVSPFWDMEHVYDWAFSSPMDKLNVFMKNYKDGERVFDATLNLKRSILNKRSLFFSVFKYPFMTIKVVFWIHLQAFFLWLRSCIDQFLLCSARNCLQNLKLQKRPHLSQICAKSATTKNTLKSQRSFAISS